MTDTSDAANQAQAQFESIKEMVGDLRAGRENDNESQMEAAEQRIHDDALSVEVRSEWHKPGSETYAAEYQILLCTGGPAVQIVGDVNEHNEPGTARLQHQDWFQPWSDWVGNCAAVESVLLDYARCFYFGE